MPRRWEGDLFWFSLFVFGTCNDIVEFESASWERYNGSWHGKHLRDEAGSLLAELGGAEEVVVVVASGGTAIAALICSLSHTSTTSMQIANYYHLLAIRLLSTRISASYSRLASSAIRLRPPTFCSTFTTTASQLEVHLKRHLFPRPYSSICARCLCRP